MDHGEAIEMMAAERYLLDELSPEQRDAFEQHLFGCPDCALDIRAGAAFINEARSQLSKDAIAPAASPPASLPRQKKSPWSWLWQPAFAVPVFATLLAVVAFQNFSTIPSLRRSATEPRVLYSNPIHAGTRGAAHTAVQADRKEGLALSLDLPQSSTYSSYVFELYGPNGKQFWTHAINRATGDDGIVSLVIPGSALQSGTYTLAISAVTPQNERVEIDRRVLDVRFQN